MRIRPALLSFLVIIIALSCNPDHITNRVLLTPTSVNADYYLPNPTGINDDVALGNWLHGINTDCSDVVIGRVPAGHYVTVDTTSLTIQSACTNPNRTVEIAGVGRNSSYIDIRSHRTVGSATGDALGFVVYDPRVTLHDIGMSGQFDGGNGDGNFGQGIKFFQAGAAGGVVHDMKLSKFGNAAVDVYMTPNVYVHDNFIDCNGSDGTGATSGKWSMGVWVRGIQTPPPPGITNGSVNSNAIFGCAYESIAIADAIHESVYYNAIHCDVGGYPAPGKSPCSIGIELHGDALPNCESTPASYNAVGYNTIYAAYRMDTGILSQGPGSGQYNLIDHNTVTNAQFHGIATNSAPCNPPDHSPTPTHTAYSNDTITYNNVSNSLNTQIWVGGSYTQVTDNTVTKGRGSKWIYLDLGTVGMTYVRNVFK